MAAIRPAQDQHYLGSGGDAIIASLLQRRGYDRRFAHALLDRARDRSADWPSRRIAVLALESQLLLLDSAAADEFVPLLERLGFTPAIGAACRPDVLKQGYTTTEPFAFFGELKRRLARLAPTHEFLLRTKASPEAVANFHHVASQECLLTLARTVFGADEVVSRVLSHVRLSAAEIDTAEDDPAFQQEASTAIEALPEYEADILLRLRSEIRTWWIGRTHRRCTIRSSSARSIHARW